MTLLKPTDVGPYIESVRGRSRLDRAMIALGAAAADAAELGLDMWQFAVEFETLAADGLTMADLRWLALKGLVEHAIENTSPGQYERVFDHDVGPTTIGHRACVTLTPLGVRVAQQLGIGAQCRAGGVPIRHPKPVWNSDSRELRVAELLVKRYRVPAPNQQMILSVFQEENWPDRIDDPLPHKPARVPKRALHDTIHSLNSSQINPLIRFYGDGSGEGVRWRLVDAGESSRAEPAKS
jgi:hypothetical protein